MAKTKISEFSSTPANNTDIDSINIAEGCAPSNINDAIRELMAQLKDFQTGAQGDSFNGPIGTSTAAAGSFTTLGASSTATLNTLVSSGATLTGGTINGMTIGATTATTGAFTTLAASSSVTLSGGTANGVTYLNGSKVLTSGSALTFNGSDFGVSASVATATIASSGAYSALSFTNSGGATKAGLILTNSSGILQSRAETSAWTNYDASSEYMRLTSTGLGIGTSSPAFKLDVTGNIRTSLGVMVKGSSLTAAASQVTLDQLNTTTSRLVSWGADTSTAGILYLGTLSSNASVGTASALVINASQNVGIGTSSPSAKLDVKQSGTNWYDGARILRSTTDNQRLVLGNTSGASWIASVDAAGGSNNAMLFGRSTDGTTFTESARFDTSGNFGIGVTSPSAKLDLAGGTGAAVTAVLIRSVSGNASGFQIVTDSVSDTVFLNNFYNAALRFGTNNTERARIDSSGNLLVGKTAQSATTLGFEVTPAGVVRSTLAGSTNATDTLDVYSTGAGAYRFYVSMDGKVNATSTTISAISDQRLKENVRDIDTGLNAVLALKPRRFDWKEGKGQDKKNAAGFIAQEFETVFPDSVGTSKAGDDGIEYKNICHEELIPTLVKAIQELKAEFDAYKASHP